MRILELRFKNLNSLYGQWTIDFTRPEYVQDGIFLIAGPTGAGKSTLLDALCLALYGRTPRLKSISKNSNEIMSRQTGECFAEVRFETDAGQFLVHWSQHRARKKPGGNLAESKHEISDGLTGTVLASLKRDTADKVLTITGMDFDRFTRSMMLAQGGFAAFLQAAADERAPILEQITGTIIYSEISKKVHERLNREKESLKLLEAQLGGIQVLSGEDEAAVNNTLAEKESKEKEVRRHNEDLLAAIVWLSTIAHLEKELGQLHQASKEWAESMADFEPDRLRLDHALKASVLDSEYATLKSKRDQQKADVVSLEHLQSKIPELEKSFELKSAELTSARKTLGQAKDDQKKQLDLIQKVRLMDYEIGQKQKTQQELQSECSGIEVHISKEMQGYKKAQNDQRSVEENLSHISAYLSDHKTDADLAMALATIREKADRLGEVAKTIDHLEREMAKSRMLLEKETGLYEKQQGICLECSRDLESAVQIIQQIEKEMKNLLNGRSLAGLRNEYDALLREMAYKRTIASLEAERSQLRHGEACPLCGSMDHPFVENQVPHVDDTQEKINALAKKTQLLEGMESDLKSAGEKEKEAVQKKTAIEKKAVEIQYQTQRLSEDISRVENELKITVQKKETLNDALMTILEPFGVKHVEDKGFDSMCKTLDDRVRVFHGYQKKKTEIENQLSHLGARIKQGDSVLNLLGRSLDEKTAVLKTHETLLDKLKQERMQKYDKKNPDEEERRLETKMKGMLKAEADALKHKDEILQQLIVQKARMEDVSSAVSSRETELGRLEKTFVKHLISSGFKDEAALVSCMLTADEKNILARRARSLDEKQRDIALRKEERQIHLEKERAKKLTTQPEDHLRSQQEKVLAALKQLGEDVGALKQKISDNTEAKMRIDKHLADINARKKERARWDVLHSLIGSADGKKYRNFAQGITFELMVSHANQQLEKMSDRYLLVRDERQPLELNIVDDYQAGEIRSTKNLSGGESFIVSLSLALGLSNMASGNVRVDSLFLDEGFGTLDEDALETALQALSGLQRSGKLIGVISHVPALKESINTQIQVSPLSGGKSRVQGPGCR